MKKLIELFFETVSLNEWSQEEIDAMLPGEIKAGYRKNVNSDRVNKYGGSLPADWKDRKAGVDFEPNQDLVNTRNQYDSRSEKMKSNDVSHRPKKRNDGEMWDFADWVLFPPKPDLFTGNKEEVIKTLKDFLKDTIKDAEDKGTYQSLDPEDLEKTLSSIKMDNAGNIHFYGPYRISYNRNKMSELEYKVNVLSGVNPESYGGVRKARVLPAHRAATSPKVQKRLAKPEESDGEK